VAFLFVLATLVHRNGHVTSFLYPEGEVQNHKIRYQLAVFHLKIRKTTLHSA
jgi:hypothetical protein